MAKDLAAAVGDLQAAEQAVTDAEAQLRASRAQVRVARKGLHEAIIAAYEDGTRVRDLVEVTGLSRERIRQILRAAGVEPW